MAEAFLGLKISVLLFSGLRVEGVVSQLEPSTQQMTLKEGNKNKKLVNFILISIYSGDIIPGTTSSLYISLWCSWKRD
jgi:hypothetical protein